jgi:hypothetical protein
MPSGTANGVANTCGSSYRSTLKWFGMLKRSWAYLIGLLLVCLILGTWYYKSKCRGLDACAAESAEEHERDTPKEPR